MKSTISPLMLLLVLAAPAAFAQEEIFRSTMPDGRVVYGESPFPGAKSVRKVAPPPISTGTTVVSPAEKDRMRNAVGPQGGVAVIPNPDRGTPVVVPQGGLQAPGGLPRRAY